MHDGHVVHRLATALTVVAAKLHLTVFLPQLPPGDCRRSLRQPPVQEIGSQQRTGNEPRDETQHATAPLDRDDLFLAAYRGARQADQDDYENFHGRTPARRKIPETESPSASPVQKRRVFVDGESWHQSSITSAAHSNPEQVANHCISPLGGGDRDRSTSTPHAAPRQR
jgi:hypothetical protein